MEKSSKSYRKAASLDRRGLARRLRSNTSEYISGRVEGEDIEEMGSLVSKVTETAPNVLDWHSQSTEDDDDGEFEYSEPTNEDKSAPPPDTMDITEEESEMATDPLVLKETEGMKDSLCQMRSVFSDNTGIFDLPIASSCVPEFALFIKWVNATSGKTYIISEENPGTIRIAKLPDTETDPAKPSTSFALQSPPIESQSHSMDSEDVTTGRYSPPIEISSRNLTSNSQSLFSQLMKGVIIPARTKKLKDRKIKLSSFGIPEGEIMGILSDNPTMKMEGLIKRMYQIKGEWKIFNSLYNVNTLKLVSSD